MVAAKIAKVYHHVWGNNYSRPETAMAHYNQGLQEIGVQYPVNSDARTVWQELKEAVALLGE